MKQSCAGNIIWRQVKERMARVKLQHIFFFHLKFVKMNSIRQVENMRMNLRQYQTHNEV